MIGAFSFIIYLGPIALSILVLAILIKCFQEIISIGYKKYKEYNLPLYRVLNWYVHTYKNVGRNVTSYFPSLSPQRYFLLVATYFLYGDNFFFYFPEYHSSAMVSP